MNCFLDIESIPCQTPGFSDELFADIAKDAIAKKALCFAPSNYKDPDKIEAYITEARRKIDDDIDAEAEKQYRATALDGTFGEVFCVAWAIEDGPIEVSDLAGAFAALEAAYDPRDTPCIVGHNVPWDIRFMWQHAKIKGIAVPRWWPVKAKPWEDAIFDTMTQWCGVGNRVKLDKLCKAFGIKGKDGFDGSMVYDAWLAKERDKIREYCREDVMRVRELYRRMK